MPIGMRPRSELLVAIAIFAAIVLLAVASGQRQRGNISTDLRTSSLSTGPAGTRALAAVIERAGGRVTRWTSRLDLLPDSLARDAAILVVEPRVDLTGHEVSTLLGLTGRTASVVLAGPLTLPAVRCLGYRFDYSLFDSLRVRGPSGASRGHITTTLVRDTVPARPRNDLEEAPVCPVFADAGVDTLLRTTGNAAVMLRVRRLASPHVVLILSDASLLGTAALARPELPQVIVRTLLALGPHVIFDEYHQEGTGGSMWRAAVGWSRDSPWGWVLWQLGMVGLLVFLAGAVRFGPVRRAIARERRSPLEHVRALATALAAANGHDVAIGALVRGLQRRLAASGRDTTRRAPRGEWLSFVDRLAARSPDARARAGAQQLRAYAAPGQPDHAVREAANAVEDVWEALHR